MDSQVITREAVRQVLRDYWQQYKTHPWYSITGFVMPALGIILTTFVPPLIIARLVNVFVAEGFISLTNAWGLIALMGGLWFLGEIFWRIGLHFFIQMEAAGIYRLCRIAFHRLVERDYDFYTNNFVGSLSKKAMSFSRSFEQFSDTLLFNVVTSAIPILFAVVILWTYSPWLPIVLIFWIAFAFLIAYPIIQRRSKLVALRHDAGSKLVGRLSDSLTNMLAIKSFAKERQEAASYGEYADDYIGKYKRAADYQNLRFDIVMSPIYVIANVTGLIAAIFFVERLGLQAGVIVVVFAYYSLITNIFWQISKVYRNIESSISEAAEFTQLLIDPPSIQDVPDARQLNVINSSIQFKKVNFKYHDGTPDEDNLFLNNFNLDIQSNQKVGLVGSSGGGKTTIAKLLLRFIDLQSGEITIDNQNIREVTQSSLHEAIAYVPQEPLLFHRSLFENIAYGNETATKEDVVAAARLAHADEFIAQLPRGYDTLVGERGIKLSGGQRQRVAIARALLKKSHILLLDEATSSLDSESEKYIQEGLWELMKNKTALVIAHRLSTIKHLDRIIVLEQGKIVQDGTHEELIQQKGLYAKLWSHQSGEFLED